MDICSGNATGKADARHRTSPKGNLEVFIFGHACVFVFAEQGETIMNQIDDIQLRSVQLHSFSDASHAPYRFNNRKGVSGGAVFFERSLVRSTSFESEFM